MLRVVDWLSLDEITEEMKESCGGLGGWVSGHKWDEYIKQMPSEEHQHLEALRAAILEEKLRVGGDEHQHNYTPLFSDGTIGSFSFRGWGDLCAAIYNTHEDTDKYEYMSFYMGCLIQDSE